MSNNFTTSVPRTDNAIGTPNHFCKTGLRIVLNPLSTFCLAFLLLCLSSAALATTYTFTGTGSWTTPGYWSPSYPGQFINAGDEAVINGSVSIFHTTVVSVFSGGTLTNNGTISILGNLYNSGTIHNSTGRTLTVGGIGGLLNNNFNGTINNHGNLFSDRSLNNTGVINNHKNLVTSQIFTNTGTVNNNSGAIFQLSNSPAFWPGGTFNWNSGSKVQVSNVANLVITSPLFVPPGCTLQVNGILTIDFNNTTNNFALFNTGTVINNGAINIGATQNVGDNGIANAGTFTNNAGKTITINHTSDRAIDNYGPVFNNSGSIIIGAVASVGYYGLINQTTFNNNAGGQIQISNATGIGFFNLSGTFTNAGTMTQQSGAFNNSATYNLNAGASLGLNTPVAANLGVTFNWNSGSTVTIGNTASLLVTSPLTIPPGSTLNVNGTLVVGPGGSLNNQGSLYLNSTGTLEINSNPASLPGGNFIWNVGGIVKFGDTGNLVITGTVTVPAGGMLQVDGELTIPAGSELVVNGELTIVSGGALTVNPGGTLTNNSPLVNNGTLENNGTLTNSSLLTNSGTMENSGTLTNNSTLTNNGTLENSGTFSNDGILKGIGTLSQTGIYAGAPNGSIAPGASPGSFSVTGNLDLGANTLVAEINGTTEGSEHDVLNISGNANLTQAKLVVDWGSYLPSVCESFIIMTFAGHTGEFETVTIPEVPGLASAVVYSEANVTVKFLDTEPPVANCPAAITHPNDAGDCSAIVSFGLPASTDNCSGVSSAAFQVSGSAFLVGTTAVTVTATDAAMNTHACSFNVTVTDVDAPEIMCPSNVTVNCEDDNTSASTGSAEGSDNCPGVVISQMEISTQDANPANSGHYNYLITRTWKATDASDNATTCIQLITVQDVTAPSIDCPSDVTVNCEDDNTSASTGNATGNDNCSAVAITQTEVSTQDANPVHIGHYNYLITRTWQAADASVNATGCVQLITVEDATAPAVACQNVTVYQDESGQASVTESDIDNNSTDNCAPFSLSLSGQLDYGCTDRDKVITVTLTAVDVSGNTSSCTAQVTVSDDLLPDDDCDGVANVCDICDGGDDSVDNNGDDIADCSQLLAYADYSSDWKCANNKIQVCHNGNNPQTNCISKNALAAHFNHGDNIGPCTDCGGQNLQAPNGTGNGAFATAGHVGLEVFPNPANGKVNIHIHGTELKTQLVLFDSFGRAVWQQEAEAGEVALVVDISGSQFAAGVYTIRAFNESGNQSQRLVISQ